MRVLASLKGAARAIAVVHAIKTVFALFAIGELGLGLLRLAAAGDLIAQAAHAVKMAPRQAVLAQWAVCGYALLAPLLMQWLLAALIGDGRHPTLGGYLRALTLSVLRYSALLTVGACSFWSASGLTTTSWQPLEGTATTATLCAGVLAMGWLSTVHDVAQAALARSRGRGLWRAAREGLRATSWDVVAAHAGLSLLGLALFVLGDLSARALPWPAAGLIVTQALALGTTLTSATWLARALASTSQLEQASQYIQLTVAGRN